MNTATKSTIAIRSAASAAARYLAGGGLFSFLRSFPEIRTVLAVIREAERNPYRARAIASAPLARRSGFVLIIALFAISFAAAMAAAVEGFRLSPVIMIFVIYLPIRLLLIYRASKIAAERARDEASPGQFAQMAITPISPRSIVAGWALLGWTPAVAEAALGFALIYPWFAMLGPFWAFAGWIEFTHVILLQALAALVSARCIHSYSLRREAVSAGWATAGLTHPLAFTLQAIVIGTFSIIFLGFLVLIPVSAILLLTASGISGMDAWDPSGLLGWIVPVIGIAYAVWIPLACFREIDSQMESSADDERFRAYFDPGVPPRQKSSTV